jgi:ABC-type branched-subunit amino acid transport system ATPase component/ABC-type branched-subunit amino acid transport system permease subunit
MSLKTMQDKAALRTRAARQGLQIDRRRRAASLPRVLVFAAYAVLLPLPLILRNYYLIRAGGSVGIYLILAAGLSIVAGQAGLLDLGYAGFYGIGAYVYALLASPKFGLHSAFVPAAAASALAAALAGLAVSLPTLRLHGDYLAMVTLGFGQIVRILLNNMDRPINITNGPNGIVAIDPPRILGFTFSSLESSYILIWVFALIILAGIARIVGSKTGRAWNALREDETAAACMGVNVRRYRVSAFVTAAAIAGFAGALFASWQGAVFPQNFTMSETIALYCMAILGGIRSIPGIMLGVLILQVLPEVLRAYSIYRMLIYGFALVLLAVFRPQGLIGQGERLVGIGRRPLPDSRTSTQSWTRSSAGRIRAETDIQADTDAGIEVEAETEAQAEAEAGAAAKTEAAPMLAAAPGPTRTPVLEASGLSCNFGGLAAASNVSFEACAGEILGLIGPNGAGKTTLFNLITGLVKPSAGEVRIQGQAATGLDPHRVASLGVARTFQHIRLFETQSVLENVLAGCHLQGRSNVLGALARSTAHANQEAQAVARAREALALVDTSLLTREASLVRHLSYPDRRRVEVARAIATGAKLLLLDEPAAGMTPEEITTMVDEIVALRDQGYTIVVIEHHMDLIAAACDRVIAIDHGEVIAAGAPPEVAANPEVIRAYLGSPKTASAPISTAADAGAEQPSPMSPAAPEARTSRATPILELVDVHASYGPAEVLQGIDIEVRPGEVIALLGANAAGKSTAIKTIMGRLRPSSGEIRFAGRRIDGRPTNEIVRMGIGIVPEGRRVFYELTVLENLEAAAEAQASPASIAMRETRSGAGSIVGNHAAAHSRIEQVLALFPVLAERRNQPAGTLSGGEQQMLAIARALVASPQLICMDEPSMGLAPIMVDRVMEAIREINRSGTAVLLVEQNAQAALSVADRAYILRDGRIVASGTSDEMLADGRLASAYLL